MFRRALRLLSAACLALIAACQSIAGIEDRHFTPGLTGTPECETYCTHVMGACTGPNAVYPDRDSCIRVCDVLPSGEVSQDNSLECRATQAQIASNGEPDVECPGAGPFGADTCGSTCQALCTFLESSCPDKLLNVTDCVTACSGIRSDKIYDLSKLDSGDNVECRVAYAARAVADPTTFCGGAALKSDKCVDPPKGLPNCADMCKLAMTECSAENQVYNDIDECEAICGFMDLGLNQDTSGNTVGCRKYHAYNAVAGPNPHCAHAGPGGGGHCGNSCDAYCQLTKKVCPTEYQTLGGDAQCATKCGALADSKAEGYLTAAKTGNTLACRFVNLQHAAKTPTDPTFCAAVIGGGECQ